MKPIHDFVAELPLAQHCEQLIPPPAPERDLLKDVGDLACDIARELANDMATIASGKTITVTCADAARSNTTAFINRATKQTTHHVIDVHKCGAMLFSIDHRTALHLTDRAYGGTGEISDPLPDDLPFSASLTLKQISASWCESLARIFPEEIAPQVLRYGADLGRLDPFRGQSECVHLEMTVEQDGHEPWILAVSASLPDMHQTTLRHRRGAKADAAPARINDPLAEPFGDITLPARAILAQMPVSLARASAFRPGDMLPLAIAREVPLDIGGKTVALGIVGAQDDRVALQITRSFA